MLQVHLSTSNRQCTTDFLSIPVSPSLPLRQAASLRPKPAVSLDHSFSTRASGLSWWLVPISCRAFVLVMRSADERRWERIQNVPDAVEQRFLSHPELWLVGPLAEQACIRQSTHYLVLLDSADLEPGMQTQYLNISTVSEQVITEPDIWEAKMSQQLRRQIQTQGLAGNDTG